MFLEEKLLSYHETDDYGFHMPGHKRQADTNPFLGGLVSLSSIDITEIPGFDDLHEPSGILKEEMDAAATFYGTKATIFSVNGSTASNLSAISASVPFGGRLLAAANCHRSIPHAAEIRQLDLTHLPQSYVRPGIPGPVKTEAVEAALRAGAAEGRAYEAVVITSPTYEGVVSDVASIAEIVHRYGATLIVDEAHGAHFSQHPAFPVSAVRLGADLVIHSVHKTLPSLTQTSLLHNVTGRITTESLMHYMDIYESSSPSYILMASITSCLHALREQGAALFETYVADLLACRQALRGMTHLRLFECPESEISKIVIEVGNCRYRGEILTGLGLSEILRKEYHLVMEKHEDEYALAMTSAADISEGFERLTAALLAIDAEAWPMA